MGRRDAAGKGSGRFERIELVSEGERNIGRKERRRMRSISVPIPSLFGILPRLVDDTHNCLKELFRIHSMIIHSYSQSKLFCFHGIGKLVTK